MCNDCLSLPQSQKVKARVRLNFFFFLVLINNFHFQMVYYYKEGIEIPLDLNIQFFFTSSNIKLSYEDTPFLLYFNFKVVQVRDGYCSMKSCSNRKGILINN